jgi:hypothetical protein
MTQLFKRAGSLQIDTLKIPFGLDGLACEFNVEKRLDSRPNTCELGIFNLSPDHRGELSAKAAAAKKKKVVVEVEAGYEGNVSRIFRGDLRFAFHKREGADIKTTIEAGDGEFSVSRAKIFKSWAPGTPVSTVLSDVVGALGLGKGNLAQATIAEFLGGGTAFVGGTACSGRAMKELTRITQSLGLQWSIQDGTLQFLSTGQALQGTAVLLSSSTGMIGAPDIDQKGIVKVRSLLQPDIFPGRKIKLDAAELQGFYRAEKCRYTGDTYGNDWYVDVEAHKL